MQAKSQLLIAALHERQGDARAQLRALEAATQAAESAGEHDVLFEASFRLYRALRDSRPGRATRHLQACAGIYPLLASRTPLVGQFEAELRDRR